MSTISNSDKPKIEKCPESGKYAYSLREAQGVKNLHKKKDGIEMRIYECEFGKHYHLTSKIHRENYRDDTPYHRKISHRNRSFREKNHFKHKRY